MRARGVHNSKLFQFEQNVLQGKSSSLGAAFQDRKTADKLEAQKKNEIKTWLLLFAKHVGDNLPNELVTVLPYWQKMPIWQEYTDDLTTAKFVYRAPAKISHFRSVFNKVSVKHNICLLRKSGLFVTCSICTAYHNRLREVTSNAEREQLKTFRRLHLDKQWTQREKYSIEPHFVHNYGRHGPEKDKLACS